jgi:hypothetical protein
VLFAVVRAAVRPEVAELEAALVGGAGYGVGVVGLE